MLCVTEAAREASGMMRKECSAALLFENRTVGLQGVLRPVAVGERGNANTERIAEQNGKQLDSRKR